MAEEQKIEFVAKVDDSNQVVPTNPTSTPQQPIPVDTSGGLQDAINNSFNKEVAENTLEEAIRSSIAREAQLRVLRETNASIKAMEAAIAGGGSGQPPIEPPTDIPSGFFDPEDNGEIPDLERLAQEQQDAIDDLIRSFDKVDNPSIDQQRFEEDTAEFDRTFADMDAVEDTMASFGETAGLTTEALKFLGPEAAAAAKTVEMVGGAALGAATALSSLIVASQLYSSVLAATIENFGELSQEVQRQQAQTEANRIQQQMEFANEFGDVLADMEENRDRLRNSQREFLANLLDKFAPVIDAVTSGLTGLLDVLNLILTLAGPMLETIRLQAAILDSFYKLVSGVAKTINPFQWFKSDKNSDNVSVWDNLGNPENFLSVDNIRPKNTNGRDVYDMDDLFKKNL
jgi:hypothetical protein